MTYDIEYESLVTKPGNAVNGFIHEAILGIHLFMLRCASC
jgi:hypothetical protein